MRISLLVLLLLCGAVAPVVTHAAPATLGWKDHSDNEDGFRIKRKPRGSTQDYVTVAEVAADATHYVDDVPPGTEWCYVVEAFNTPGGASGPSNEACGVRPDTGTGAYSATTHP